MKSLKEAVAEAEEKKVAIGHFNVSDTEAFWAIVNAARSLSVPVIIGVSEGERDFIGVRQVEALVKSVRDEFDFPIYLNADHTYSVERIEEAVHAGFDSVIFDQTKLPLEENITVTKEAVERAKSINPDVLVEGEFGYIGTSSKVLDAIPEGAEITEEHLSKPEELAQFVSETGVDMVAPAVGNLHGMLKHGKNPNLSIKRIAELRTAGGVPMTLHGGSGISDEDFRKAIEAGMSIVHINTEIRRAYRAGIERVLKESPEEVAPYRFLKGGVEDMQRVVEARLRLFNKINI